MSAGREGVTSELIAALRNQRQLDNDGCEVGISRQAADEAADLLATLTAELGAMREALRAVRNIAEYSSHTAHGLSSIRKVVADLPPGLLP